jgi:hypothetical protein
MKKLTILLASALAVGCATVPYQPYAREVKKRPKQGGMIALHAEYRPEDRARAEFLMGANCGGPSGFNVTEEGEAIVGEKTSSNSNKRLDSERDSGFSIGGISFASGDYRPGENVNTESQTTQLKEWRIAYQCAADAQQPGGRGKKMTRR